MKNLKISMKLVVSFCILIVLAVVVGLFGIIGMYMMNVADDGLYNGNYLPTVMAGDISQHVVAQRTYMRNFIIYDVVEDAEIFAAAEKSMNTSRSEMTKLFEEYEPTIVLEEDQAAYDEFVKVYNSEWLPALDAVYNYGKNNDVESAKAALTAAAPAATKMDELSSTLQNVNLDDGQRTVDSNTALFTTMAFVEVAILVVSILIAVFLIRYISGLIAKPLSRMAESLEQIGSKGDLILDADISKSAQEYATWNDEVGTCARAVSGLIGHLLEVEQALTRVADGDLTVEVKTLSDRDNIGISLAKMAENLNKMFGEINASTAQVATGSKQIADGSQALAQGSTEQAAAVEQLSSSISEIANKTKENADMAGKAAVLAETIKGNAEKGSRQMDEMMSAVKDINDASQSINKVIKVIDDIAFQTNILALNAAVEAARAGQHGKGFAVVAEEVRSLAAKSADAAKDTGGLIANSIEKAELGARIAGETAASLAEIVSGINESGQLIGDIAKSSEEQSAGITQINKGIDQVAQVIQQNSATAEESAAASEEMSGQSQMLEDLISQFKLKESGSRRGLQGRHEPVKQLAMPERPVQNTGEYGKY